MANPSLLYSKSIIIFFKRFTEMLPNQILGQCLLANFVSIYDIFFMCVCCMSSPIAKVRTEKQKYIAANSGYNRTPHGANHAQENSKQYTIPHK